MGYLRRLFLVVAVAVQLVTLAYVMVVMGQSRVVSVDHSIINSTDATALYWLSAAAALLTVGLGAVLWAERRGPSRRRGRETVARAVPADDPSADADGVGR